MRASRMRTFVVVVVDQLMFDDARHLSRVCELLGNPVPVDVEYFPTLTETAHASISTGTLPMRHGVIGDETYVPSCAGDLESVWVDDEVYVADGIGSGRPLVHDLYASGVQSFVISGKPKVALLLDPLYDRAGGSTRITFEFEPDQNDKGLMVYEIGEGGQHRKPRPPYPRPSNRLDPNLDRAMFNEANEALAFQRKDDLPAFLFLGLSRLDTLGHENHRSSSAFVEALALLDELIFELLADHGLLDDDVSRVIITGDHGCRNIQRLVALSEDNRHLKAWATEPWTPQAPLFSMPLPVDLLRQDSNSKPAVILDGGTIRFWVQEGEEEKIVTWLRDRCFSFLDVAGVAAELPSEIGPWTRASVHANWGDVVGIASRDVALCKRSWLFGGAHDFPSTRVVGEHGTATMEDRRVPWWGHKTDHSGIADAVKNFLAPRTRTSSSCPEPK